MVKQNRIQDLISSCRYWQMKRRNRPIPRNIPVYLWYRVRTIAS